MKLTQNTAGTAPAEAAALSNVTHLVQPTDTTNQASTTTADQPAERELTIKVWRDEFAHFEGTAAQLIAEGLIPDGFEWPHAAAEKFWEANGFKYWVKRKRPAGHKGLKRTWLQVDNWFIRVKVVGRDHEWSTRRALQRKAEELRAEFHRLTPAGSREWHASWARYWAAQDDKAFQAFKALVPGLVPPKRGRKPKSATQATKGSVA